MKELSTLVNFVSLHHKSFLDSNLTIGVFGRGFGGALAVLNTIALAANPKVTRITLYTEECLRVLAEDGAAFFELLCKTPIINRVVQAADASSTEQRRPMSRICVVDWTSRWESFSTWGGLKPHVQPVVLQTDCPARTAGSWAPFVKGYQKAFTSYVGKPSTAASALLKTTTCATAAQVLNAIEVKLVGQSATTTLPITVTVPAKANSKKQEPKTHVERIPAIVTWVTVRADDSTLTAIVEYTCTCLCVLVNKWVMHGSWIRVDVLFFVMCTGRGSQYVDVVCPKTELVESVMPEKATFHGDFAEAWNLQQEVHRLFTATRCLTLGMK